MLYYYMRDSFRAVLLVTGDCPAVTYLHIMEDYFLNFERADSLLLLGLERLDYALVVVGGWSTTTSAEAA
jgi:hypothetical protein